MPAGEGVSGGFEDAKSDEDDRDKDNGNSSKKKNYEKVEEGEKKNKPLSLEWPDTRRKKATYLFLLPIILPLWLTVPDVRNQVRTRHISEISCGILNASTVCFCFCPTEIQKILHGHLPGLYSVDYRLILPHGVVGPSGQLL